MAKKSYSAGEVLGAAATVAGGTGLAVALSSHTMARLASMVSNPYAEVYQQGQGGRAMVLRALPGLAATGIGMLVAGPSTVTGAIVGALGLGGTAIGALSPVVQRSVGANIAQQLATWRQNEGMPVYQAAMGGPAPRALATMEQLSLGGSLGSTQAHNLAVGGSITPTNLAVTPVRSLAV